MPTADEGQEALVDHIRVRGRHPCGKRGRFALTRNRVRDGALGKFDRECQTGQNTAIALSTNRTMTSQRPATAMSARARWRRLCPDCANTSIADRAGSIARQVSPQGRPTNIPPRIRGMDAGGGLPTAATATTSLVLALNRWTKTASASCRPRRASRQSICRAYPGSC